jgi:hypothetical protein
MNNYLRINQFKDEYKGYVKWIRCLLLTNGNDDIISKYILKCILLKCLFDKDYNEKLQKEIELNSFRKPNFKKLLNGNNSKFSSKILHGLNNIENSTSLRTIPHSIIISNKKIPDTFFKSFYNSIPKDNIEKYWNIIQSHSIPSIFINNMLQDIYNELESPSNSPRFTKTIFTDSIYKEDSNDFISNKYKDIKEKIRLPIII